MIHLGDNLKELEEIVNKLNVLDAHNNEVIYESKNDGTIIGLGLFKDKYIAVQRAFISKGTISTLHDHKETEYLIVYKGKVEMEVSGLTYVLGVEDRIRIKSHLPHTCEALEDTWLIAITIPASEEFPDA